MRKKKSKNKQKAKTSSRAAKKTARRKPAVVAKKARKAPTRKAVQKKSPSKKIARRRPGASVNSERDIRQEIEAKNFTSAPVSSARSSSDFEGLSRVEQADSESVDELVEEGNLFEAGAVAGVEEADNADEKEVHTHEVPEDDVPEEYLDKE